MCINRLTKINNKKWLIYQHYTLKKTLTKIAYELGYANSCALGKHFKKFNIPVLTNFMTLEKIKLINKLENNNQKTPTQILIDNTGYLPNNASSGQRFWHILNNTKEIPKCSCCNNQVKWHYENSNLGYYTHCSYNCAQSSKIVRAKSIRTLLSKKYIPESIGEIIKKTIFLSKTAIINQRLWHINNNIKHIPKCLECNNNVKWQQHKKNYHKYCSAKCSTNSKIIQYKVKQTNNKKYGSDYHTQQYLPKDTLEKIKDRKWLINQHYVLKKSISLIAKELGYTNECALGKHFKKFNIKLTTFPTSTNEQKIITYLRCIYLTQIEAPNYNLIKPQHLDIYLPKIKLAIEFNGLYHHSVEKQGRIKQSKNKNYHFNKSLKCSNKGIKLIHIFENEWQNDQDNIKYWLKKYINQDNDFITKDVLIKDLDNKSELNLSLNWPINYDKLEELGYNLDKRLEPKEQLLNLKNRKRKYKIYDCGRVIYYK